ncbi:MAG: hypothetical protein ABW034_03415 [Steroidobacteraceae bacterium]
MQRFTDADPLDGTPPATRNRTPREWMQMAAAHGDRYAALNFAREDVTRYPEGSPERIKLISEDIPRYMQGAVTSKDADAIFAMGGLLTFPGLLSDPLPGLAWMLTACSIGYDCSMANEDIGHGCVERGMCDPNMTLRESFQREWPAEPFARVYALEQEITYKFRAGDVDGLQEFMRLRAQAIGRVDGP